MLELIAKNVSLIFGSFFLLAGLVFGIVAVLACMLAVIGWVVKYLEEND